MITEEAVWVARCDTCRAEVWRAESKHRTEAATQAYTGALIRADGSVMCQKCRISRSLAETGILDPSYGEAGRR